MLFSAGTALRPLLRNGFVPDFHCELENVLATVDALKEAGKYGDLSADRADGVGHGRSGDPADVPGDNLFLPRSRSASTR